MNQVSEEFKPGPAVHPGVTGQADGGQQGQSQDSVQDAIHWAVSGFGAGGNAKACGGFGGPGDAQAQAEQCGSQDGARHAGVAVA